MVKEWNSFTPINVWNILFSGVWQRDGKMALCMCLCMCVLARLRVCVCVSVPSCQTEPCEECEFHGQSHAVGDRWKAGQCQLCHCLPNLTVQCAPYCQHAATGCPQVRNTEVYTNSACVCVFACAHARIHHVKNVFFYHCVTGGFLSKINVLACVFPQPPH